jgi:uncharacterized protein YabE (DUF348 family)
VKYGLNAAVLAGLAAAPVVWTSVDKTVELVVDGRASAVHTTAATVGDVLHQQGYRVTTHDLVAPGVRSSLGSHSRVVLRRGRLLHLTVDGRRTDVWTVAPTVAQALSQLGYGSSAAVSVSRSRRLPLSPTSIAIRTPQLVTLVHDGKTQEVTTTDATVGELLDDLQLTVGSSDRVSPAPDAALATGTTVRIQRVTTHLLSRVEATPFPTRKLRDAQLYAGTTKVVHPGRSGKIKITYSIVYVDGKPVGRTKVGSVTLSKASARVLAIGTKRVIVAARTSGGSGGSTSASVASQPEPSAGTAKAYAKSQLASYGWSADQYDCLVTLWNHESGWRVHAANPSGAYGIPQALPGSKMGPGWQNSYKVQIDWGLGYIKSRYSSPCGAWSQWQANGGWY